MKKWLSLALAIVLCLVLAAGCGSSEASDPAEVKGEVFDAGEVSALVPEGWMAIPGSDLFDEYEGDTNPFSFSIYKGAKSEWDMFSCPGLTISFYPADEEFYSAKDWYDEVQDLDPITMDNYTWTGYTGKSLDTPITVLEAKDGDNDFQVSLTTEMDNKTISLEDADVQAIIASIQPSK